MTDRGDEIAQFTHEQDARNVSDIADVNFSVLNLKLIPLKKVQKALKSCGDPRLQDLIRSERFPTGTSNSKCVSKRRLFFVFNLRRHARSDLLAVVKSVVPEI